MQTLDNNLENIIKELQELFNEEKFYYSPHNFNNQFIDFEHYNSVIKELRNYNKKKELSIIASHPLNSLENEGYHVKK